MGADQLINEPPIPEGFRPVDPPIPKGFRRVSDKLPGPPESIDEKRAINSFTLSEVLDVSPSIAYDTHDEVMNQIKERKGDEDVRRISSLISEKQENAIKMRKEGSSFADIAREAGKGVVERLLGIPEAVNTTFKFVGNQLSQDILAKYIPLGIMSSFPMDPENIRRFEEDPGVTIAEYGEAVAQESKFKALG